MFKKIISMFKKNKERDFNPPVKGGEDYNKLKEYILSFNKPGYRTIDIAKKRELISSKLLREHFFDIEHEPTTPMLEEDLDSMIYCLSRVLYGYKIEI